MPARQQGPKGDEGRAEDRERTGTRTTEGKAWWSEDARKQVNVRFPSLEGGAAAGGDGVTAAATLGHVEAAPAATAGRGVAVAAARATPAAHDDAAASERGGESFSGGGETGMGGGWGR